MPIEPISATIAGLITAEKLAEELKEPAKKAFGWLFEKFKGEYDEYQLAKAFEKLAEKTTEVVKVKTIYKGDESIDLHEFYVPAKIHSKTSDINFIDDISEHKAIVLEGTVGQGKSIFMRFLTYQEAKLGQRVPIFYELRRLEDGQSLTSAISHKISNWIPEFDESDFDTVAKTGNLVLFLDGFDEVAHDDVKRLLNELENWCERYPDMQVVISTRPQADIQRSNYTKVFKLVEYRFYEQSLLIDKLVEETESKELLKQAIKDSSTEIQELLKTPLLVTLLVMNYRGTLEIPNNQYEFYKDLFSVLVSRHDKTKPGFKRELSSRLSTNELQEIFEQFCFISLNNDKLTFSHSEAIEIIEKCLEKQSIRADSEQVLSDFAKVICLLLKDGRNYTFVHKSIPEYYCASHIERKSENAKSNFYRQCLEKQSAFRRFQNVISFLEIHDEYPYKKFLALPKIQTIIEEFNKLNNNQKYDLVYLKKAELIFLDRIISPRTSVKISIELNNYNYLVTQFISQNTAFSAYTTFSELTKVKKQNEFFSFKHNVKKTFNNKKAIMLLDNEYENLSQKLYTIEEIIIKFIQNRDDIELNL